MEIAWHIVTPVPLKDRFAVRESGVWGHELCFNPGERVKIQAPSGSGKTTFVHILYGERFDYEGSVDWGGRDIRNYKASEKAVLRQSSLSVVFQDMRLFPQLTCRENIELKRLLAPDFESLPVEEMAGKLGVTHVLEQLAGTCSYGEQQRVAIIRALVQPFSWLVLDEPFSHLDQANTQHAAALIASECDRRNAGFLLTDLDKDDHFTYTRTLLL